jgi:hypothetical protein
MSTDVGKTGNCAVKIKNPIPQPRTLNPCLDSFPGQFVGFSLDVIPQGAFTHARTRAALFLHSLSSHQQG